MAQSTSLTHKQPFHNNSNNTAHQPTKKRILFMANSRRLAKLTLPRSENYSPHKNRPFEH
eukprot:m.138817 g.138817  ORF g.138817 m.138817 type:complete len:60 (-) comp14005_c0_seq6:1411-1590(-)